MKEKFLISSFIGYQRVDRFVGVVEKGVEARSASWALEVERMINSVSANRVTNAFIFGVRKKRERASP